MKHAAVGLSLFFVLGLTAPGFAQELKVAGTSVSVSAPGAAMATLTVVGPGGFEMQTFSKSGAAMLRLGSDGKLEDGTYTYEFTAATSEMVPNTNKLNNGRGQEPAMMHASMTKSGTFTVEKGRIIETPASGSESDKDG